MRVYTKVCAAAGLVLAATGLAPAAAVAATPPQQVAVGQGCDETDDYGAELPCDVRITLLEPICDGDVPRLRYAVAPVGTDETTVDLTFVNPDGDDVVYADQPLAGTVLWPGAVVDAAGAPLDWPGWRLENGTWVTGDEYDWVRPSVQVTFEVNPAVSAVVAYPPSSPVCLTEPERSDVLVAGGAPARPAAARAEVLSATGSTVGPIVLISAGLVLAGAGGVVAARSRRA